jgi:O-antigen/teichoic acid export membrane protein
LLRGAGLFLGVHVASLGIACLANAFTARRIGEAAYGEFAYGITLKSFLLVPATFGLGVGALLRCGGIRTLNEPTHANAVAASPHPL